MNYKRIERFTLISICALSFILLVFGFKYSLGLVLGGLASLFSLKMIERLENVEIKDYKILKSRLRRNHLIRYLVYSIVLLGSFLRPNTFSFITCFVGVLMSKVWIVIVESKELKEG